MEKIQLQSYEREGYHVIPIMDVTAAVKAVLMYATQVLNVPVCISHNNHQQTYWSHAISNSKTDLYQIAISLFLSDVHHTIS